MALGCWLMVDTRLLCHRLDSPIVHCLQGVWTLASGDGRSNKNGSPAESQTNSESVEQEIEQLRAAYAHLQREHEQQRLVVDNMREYAVVGIDLNQVICSWSEGARRIL